MPPAGIAKSHHRSAEQVLQTMLAILDLLSGLLPRQCCKTAMIQPMGTDLEALPADIAQLLSVQGWQSLDIGKRDEKRAAQTMT